jgi:hypothetical protein
MIPRILAAFGMIVTVMGIAFLAIGPVSSANPAPDPTYVKECSACHLAYPSQFLPKRSWDRILGSLDKHFGENATLPAKSLASIKTYLEAHAADSGNANPRILAGVTASQTPLRITELPYWTRIHSRLMARKAFDAPKVKSAANCTACHRGAANGVFGDDD